MDGCEDLIGGQYVAASDATDKMWATAEETGQVAALEAIREDLVQDAAECAPTLARLAEWLHAASNGTGSNASNLGEGLDNDAMKTARLEVLAIVFILFKGPTPTKLVAGC